MAIRFFLGRRATTPKISQTGDSLMDRGPIIMFFGFWLIEYFDLGFPMGKHCAVRLITEQINNHSCLLQE